MRCLPFRRGCVLWAPVVCERCLDFDQRGARFCGVSFSDCVFYEFFHASCFFVREPSLAVELSNLFLIVCRLRVVHSYAADAFVGLLLHELHGCVALKYLVLAVQDVLKGEHGSGVGVAFLCCAGFCVLFRDPCICFEFRDCGLLSAAASAVLTPLPSCLRLVPCFLAVCSLRCRILR